MQALPWLLIVLVAGGAALGGWLVWKHTEDTVEVKCSRCGRTFQQVKSDSPVPPVCRGCQTGGLTKESAISERTSFNDRPTESPLKERELRD